MGNIVFFCSTCLEKVPMALHHYETQVCVDQRLESIDNKLSEVHSTKQKLSDVIKCIETQLGGYRKEISNAILSESMSVDKSASAAPLHVSEDSVARIAASLVTEQKEGETPDEHYRT